MWCISCYLVLAWIHLSSQDIPFSGPRPKTWWAKQINSDIYTAGRLSERQLKYAVDAGFRSIVSTYYYNEGDVIGDEILPSTEASRVLVQDLGGGDFYYLALPHETLDTKTYLERFTMIMPSIQTPVLFFCTYSNSSTFLSLLFLAGQSKINVSNDKKISAHMFYERAASLGFSFNSLDERKLVSEVIEEEVEENPPQPVLSIPDWFTKYWLLKPIHGNLYLAGQIQTNYISNIKDAGFQVIVNSRKGLTFKGEPSQEEVLLVNVKDNQGMIKDGRQKEENLKQDRVSEQRSKRYISPDAIQNYELKNVYEFGDEIGYNEELERQFMESMELE